MNFFSGLILGAVLLYLYQQRGAGGTAATAPTPATTPPATPATTPPAAPAPETKPADK